uniref:Piezo_RRas_bdg domain-containing protein n=1 Tax=Ascaris lumbricoides TaxID=6252 RepID=A0A0M3HI93_ASCLU
MGKCRMLDLCGNIWIAFIIYCRYIELYSYRFTKGDHIELVRLMYQCLFEEYFDEDIIKICARTLTNLLRYRRLLNRMDLSLGWRPLYDLYVKSMQGKTPRIPSDEEGISAIEAMIAACRYYFPLEATREILDEVYFHFYNFYLLYRSLMLSILPFESDFTSTGFVEC